jgi:hypothetical protein
VKEKDRLSWLGVFQHEFFKKDKDIQIIVEEYRQNIVNAEKVFDGLVKKVKLPELLILFLRWKKKVLDYGILK